MLYSLLFLALIALVFWLVFVAEKRLSATSKERMFVVADKILRELAGIKAKQDAKKSKNKPKNRKKRVKDGIGGE